MFAPRTCRRYVDCLWRYAEPDVFELTVQLPDEAREIGLLTGHALEYEHKERETSSSRRKDERGDNDL